MRELSRSMSADYAALNKMVGKRAVMLVRPALRE
jgi:hypothetical protein